MHGGRLFGEDELTHAGVGDDVKLSPEELRSVGDAHLEEQKYDKAISAYSLALRLSSDKAAEAGVLCSRSVAFQSLSKQLRSIPAARSERSALFGYDPLTLAELALRDGQRAGQLEPRTADGLLQVGHALMLLERYPEAAEAYLSGLSVQPAREDLQGGLKKARAAMEGCGSPTAAGVARQPSLRQAAGPASGDAECTLCMKLLYEPVTTPCGHSFCKACFARATDHQNRCPMCRTVLHVGADMPVTVVLAGLLEQCFPAEYAERRREAEAEAAGHAEGGADVAAGGGPGADREDSRELQEPPIPLFVMSCMPPGYKMALNIFEPRYRLMVRRCMAGSRRFGMATGMQGGGVHPIAAECEITECQPQPDGRFYLELVALRRFRVVSTAEHDGYRVATPAYLADEPVGPGTPEGAELAELAAQVDSLMSTWVDRLRAASVGRRGYRLLELLARAGERPPPTRPEAFSFWVLNLVPVSMEERLHMMGVTSTRERLAYERDLLRRPEHSLSGCTMS